METAAAAARGGRRSGGALRALRRGQRRGHLGRLIGRHAGVLGEGLLRLILALVIGRERDRLGECDRGVALVALLAVRHAEVVVGLEHVGLYRDRLLVLHHGLVGIVGVEVHRAEVGDDLGILGIVLQVMLVGGRSLIVMLLVVVDVA